MQSLRGQFLLATHELKDGLFERSVILMLRHDGDGAVGVILNAPLSATVADALGEDIAVSVDELLRRGGPCEGPLMVVHETADLETSNEVLPGVFYTYARSDIEHIMSSNAGSRAIYVLGYAGWQADQLEREFDEGSWATLPATSAEIFGDANDLWQRLSTRAGLLKFLPRHKIPDEPGLN